MPLPYTKPKAARSRKFCATGWGSQNLPLSYVQGTRSRWATHLYTERALYNQIYDLEESFLVSHMEREFDLSLAADLFVPPSGVGGTAGELIEKVLEEWKQQDKATSLIVAKSEPDAEKFNSECHKIQYAMAQSDWEKRRSFDNEQDEAQMPIFASNSTTIVIGDRVRLPRGTLGDGIVEHELGTISDITPDKLGIQLDRGPAVEFRIDKVPELEHGYAVSYEQAQAGRYRMEKGYWLSRKNSTRLPITLKASLTTCSGILWLTTRRQSIRHQLFSTQLHNSLFNSNLSIRTWIIPSIRRWLLTGNRKRIKSTNLFLGRLHLTTPIQQHTLSMLKATNIFWN